MSVKNTGVIVHLSVWSSKLSENLKEAELDDHSWDNTLFHFHTVSLILFVQSQYFVPGVLLFFLSTHRNSTCQLLRGLKLLLWRWKLSQRNISFPFCIWRGVEFSVTWATVRMWKLKDRYCLGQFDQYSHQSICWPLKHCAYCECEVYAGSWMQRESLVTG